MTIVDANLLLYAVNASDRNHEAARSWLEGALNGREAVGFSWLVLIAFLRIATNRRAFSAPLEVEQAVGCIERWLHRPASVIVEPVAGHVAVLGALIRETGTGGNLVNDAHLAALAVEHGATIASFDHDFLRFPGIRLTVPSSR